MTTTAVAHALQSRQRASGKTHRREKTATATATIATLAIPAVGWRDDRTSAVGGACSPIVQPRAIVMYASEAIWKRCSSTYTASQARTAALPPQASVSQLPETRT